MPTLVSISLHVPPSFPRLSLFSIPILFESLRILCAEVVIDIFKHACLGKFTDVRPGIYKEYMKVWSKV